MEISEEDFQPEQNINNPEILVNEEDTTILDPIENSFSSEEFIIPKGIKNDIKNDKKKIAKTPVKIVSETPTVISVKEALNEYFKLKNQLKSQLSVFKKKINANFVGNKERRNEYLKMRPKCVNCKRPSKLGSIFTTKIVENPDLDSSRMLKASCGVIADPCNLNIEILLSKTENINDSLNQIQDAIKKEKDEIITDKNKLLFGIIDTDTALQNFEKSKELIGEYTSMYESFLELYNDIENNAEKNRELEENLVSYYNYISEIKTGIKNANETGNTQFIKDAVAIYVNTLMPIVSKIRALTYKDNDVIFEDGYCKLIQNKTNILNNLSSYSDDKVVNFDVGLKATIKNKKLKKPLVVIESDSNSVDELVAKKGDADRDEPIYGQGEDGIMWNNPNYQALWKKLPISLKDVIKLDREWLTDFMYNCLQDRKKPFFNGCKLPAPKNIVLPPMPVGENKYDFGVKIYNDVFNKLDPATQSTYLTLFNEDPSTKEKDYSKLAEAVTDLVERQIMPNRII